MEVVDLTERTSQSSPKRGKSGEKRRKAGPDGEAGGPASSAKPLNVKTMDLTKIHLKIENPIVDPPGI